MKMESVSLRREVITGPSKAADYVNFTGHSLLGHAPPLPHSLPLSLFFFFEILFDTFTLCNESRRVTGSNVH